MRNRNIKLKKKEKKERNDESDKENGKANNQEVNICVESTFKQMPIYTMHNYHSFFTHFHFFSFAYLLGKTMNFIGPNGMNVIIRKSHFLYQFFN